MFRANLCTDTAARTKDRIDVNPVFFDKKGGARQVVDTISVSFTFFTDKKRFSLWFFQNFGKQRAWFSGNNHRNPFVHQGVFNGIDALFNPVWPNDRNMFDTDSLNNVINGYPGISFKFQRFHVNTGMGLMAGHGRDAIVKNHQRKIVIVKNRVDQTGYSGMKESGISDKRYDFLVCNL